MKLGLVLSAMTATLAAAGFTSSALAGTVAEDTLQTLGSLKGIYQSTYAPSAWKKKFANYDLNTQYAKDVSLVQANPNFTIADSKDVFKDFIFAMRDYHTSITFTGSEQASLPFTLQVSGDRYFIMFIDRAKLSKASFPYEVGDELVTMDGRPTKDVAAEIQAQFTQNVPSTDKMLAAMRVTARAASRGVKVPQGPVVLGIKRNGQSAVTSYQTLWSYVPERIRPRGDLLSRSGSNSLAANPSAQNAFMAIDVADTKVKMSTDNPFDIGGKTTFTPALGTKIWTAPADSTFDAYMYKTADRRIVGYVRIPQYEVDGDQYVKAVADFALIINQFQSSTDAMVIDQVNNPGGSVAYLYALTSMLTDHPIKTPRHHIKLTQTTVQDALDEINKLQNVKNDDDAVKVMTDEVKDGFPVTFQRALFALNFDKFIVDEWNAGRTLTNATWIEGVDQVNPSSVAQYTKPILILTNGLDFSGGDFFPTTMQDNGRAVIMGTRTAGAGGFIVPVTLPNNLGIKSFVATGSIAERLDGNPIENLGVTPDVPYNLTPADYQNNFADYVNAINAQISKMTP